MKSYQRCFGALLSKRFKLKDFFRFSLYQASLFSFSVTHKFCPLLHLHFLLRLAQEQYGPLFVGPARAVAPGGYSLFPSSEFRNFVSP